MFSKDSDGDGVRIIAALHGGRGRTSVKVFGFEGAPHPARFLTYDFPPGASEGVHTHRLGDEEEGAFDEYYYIVSGQGQMEIDGQIVPVKAGDHVHAPLDCAHGIENTHPTENLKVFLTFIERFVRPQA